MMMAKAINLRGFLGIVVLSAAFSPGSVAAEPGEAVTPSSDQAQGRLGIPEFAPPPDFQRRVDYEAWLRVRIDAPAENAAEAYARLFADVEATHPQSEWRQRFRDRAHDGLTDPPGPWDPATHADWEKSWAWSQPLRQRLAEIARMPVYRTQWPRPTTENQGDALLGRWPIGSGPPYRSLLYATASAGWRKAGGIVQVAQMIEALETLARCAAHRGEGISVTEWLTAIGTGKMLREHARWAVARGVFGDEAALASAQRMLAECDRALPPVLRILPYEHACVMDALQRLYAATAPDGKPALDREAARAVLGARGADDEESNALALSPAEILDTVQAVDAYFKALARLAAAGYPQVRASDFAAAERPVREKNAVTKMLLMPLERAYVLQAHAEAERRATQLVFAIHLFEQQRGRWPRDLEELPAEHTRDVRVDPFTGRDFSYRLDADGFRLYSAGENGRDDGGAHVPSRAADTSPEQAPDDLLFWPVRP